MPTARRRVVARAVRTLAVALLVTGGLALAGATAGPAAAAPGPTVVVSPSHDLPASGADVTVHGTGFATTGPGIYVGVAAVDKFSYLDASVYDSTTWVRTVAGAPGVDVIGPDGSFTLTLTLRAAFGTGAAATDCLSTRCAVFTFAAHGSSDRSQDTVTEIGFAGSAPTSPVPSGTPPTGSGTPTSGTTTPGAPVASVTASAGTGTVRSGDTVTVTATGFAAHEHVRLVLHSDPVDLGIHQADGAGRLSVQVRIPSGVAAGAHSIRLTGLVSGAEASIPITVSAVAAPTADVAASTDRAAAATPAGLAATGARSGPLALLGTGLLVAGGTLLVLVRRPLRREH